MHRPEQKHMKHANLAKPDVIEAAILHLAVQSVKMSLLNIQIFST